MLAGNITTSAKIPGNFVLCHGQGHESNDKIRHEREGMIAAVVQSALERAALKD
jgi:hypothetical protein